MDGKDIEGLIPLTTDFHGFSRISQIIFKYFYLIRVNSRNPRTLTFLSLLLVTCYLLLACQSAPKMPQLPEIFLDETTIVPLDRGALVYIFSDADTVLPFLEYFLAEELNNKRTRQMIERTDFITAAVFPPESARRFQIVTQGSYPGFGASLAMGFNRQWKRQRTETGNYWFSAANNLSVSFNSAQAFAADSITGQPINPLAAVPGIETPAGFTQFRGSAPFSCWFNEPALMLDKLFDNAKIPIRFPAKQFFINLFPVENDQYEAILRIQFENTHQARGIAAAISLAGRFVSGQADTLFAALFFANPPIQNGSIVDIKTAAIRKNEIFFFLEMIRNF